MKRLSTWLLALAFAANSLAWQQPVAVSAADAPGTQITNSASATYKDASGTQYSTVSNTVTATVQNAPTLTNTPGSGTNYAPAQTATDSFVLANTGNASGYFQLTGDATLGGTDAASATLGNGAATCTTPVGAQSSACLYAAKVGATTYYFTSLTGSDNNALNYWLQNTNALTASSSSITLYVYYTLASNAATGSSNTVTSSISATITYAAAGSAPAETSSSQSGTVSNTVQADARLDLYKSSSQNLSTGDITYTISAHNGGAFPAKDLLSVKTLLGAPTAGILISDKVPAFGGSPLKLGNSGAVTTTTSTTYGYPTGAPTLDVYYTTVANGTSGWTKATGNLPTDGSVTYIAIFIHGGTCAAAGYELCADTGHATNPGNINVASAAAVQFSFVVQQPTGAGSANAGSISNLANGAIGDNQPTEHILGPGIPGSTADSASATPLTTSGQGINNTTLTSTGGASNQTSNQSLASYGTQNGPQGQPASSGSFDGAAASNASDDFTAASFGITADSIANSGTTAGTPVTSVSTSTAATVCVAGTIKNSGNKDDNYNITAYAPTAFAIPATGGQSYVAGFNAGGAGQVAGWSVGVYSNNSCSSLLGGAGSSSTSSTASNVSVSSGSTLTYYVGYTAPTGTAYFTRFDSLVHAVSVNDNAQVNDTHNELYSSYIALTKSQTINSTNCPSGTSPSYAAGTVCSNDSITYTIDYRNLVLGTSDTNVSFNACVNNTGAGNGLVITDDGTVSSSSSTTTQNNWGYFTTGLQSQPVDKDSSSATRSGTTLTYATGTPRGSYSATFAAGATAFTVTPGGTSFQLVPRNYNAPSSTQDWKGTITFSLVVK